MARDDRAEAIRGLEEAFGKRFVGHLVRPALRGALPQPDGRGVAASDCGHDVVEVHLGVQGGRIAEASFVVRGCVHTQASASAAVTLLPGSLLTETLAACTAEAVSAELGGLDAGHLHCAQLAVAAVRVAVEDALKTGREPWRRLYRS
jgi:nitrogen fixation protein NifU and related proteins